MFRGRTTCWTSRVCPENGMTLVETVIAVTIFSIFITGAIASIVQARMLSDEARAHYQAISICKNRLERALELDFEDVDEMIETDVLVDDTGVSDDDGLFRRTTTVTLVKQNLLQLTITCEIMNRNTREFDRINEEITTYVAYYFEP